MAWKKADNANVNNCENRTPLTNSMISILTYIILVTISIFDQVRKAFDLAESPNDYRLSAVLLITNEQS